MLAYLFWHEPRPDVDHDRYIQLLQGFHEVLRSAPPRGFRGSWSVRLETAPWDGGPAGVFEDWYLVDDWETLGGLNETATRAPRDEAHDAIAHRATNGKGGLYKLLHGTVDGPAPWAGWLTKPQGARYAEFNPEIAAAADSGGDAAVLRRQMVFGPAPEYVVLAQRPATLPWPVTETAPRPLPDR
ncbi:MAG: hypothetical protein QOD55_9 [Solirubrobacteraceae bacterium]|jgi:hypothetical protein|nr:hypothetical protein [Solirubrobacteraceae bacterium]MEA2288012.1 hypothetical protein [Solirubrobacteraceae bacterium]